MEKGLLIVFLAVAAAIIAGCAQAQAPASNPISNAGQEQAESASAQPGTAPVVKARHTVEITAAGFSPDTLTIKKGETAAFLNKDAVAHWPASAFHPSHRAYPDQGGCLGSTFDACKGLVQGEEFLFTFNHAGSWKYHDHMNPSLSGTIVVE